MSVRSRLRPYSARHQARQHQAAAGRRLVPPGPDAAPGLGPPVNGVAPFQAALSAERHREIEGIRAAVQRRLARLGGRALRRYWRQLPSDTRLAEDQAAVDRARRVLEAYEDPMVGDSDAPRLARDEKRSSYHMKKWALRAAEVATTWSAARVLGGGTLESIAIAVGFGAVFAISGECAGALFKEMSLRRREHRLGRTGHRPRTDAVEIAVLVVALAAVVGAAVAVTPLRHLFLALVAELLDRPGGSVHAWVLSLASVAIALAAALNTYRWHNPWARRREQLQDELRHAKRRRDRSARQVAAVHGRYDRARQAYAAEQQRVSAMMRQHGWEGENLRQLYADANPDNFGINADVGYAVPPTQPQEALDAARLLPADALLAEGSPLDASPWLPPPPFAPSSTNGHGSDREPSP